MKGLTITSLLIFLNGFAQSYTNTIEDFNLFISKQKNIKIENGPYKIPKDTIQYFFVGKIKDQEYYFFYYYKSNTFKLDGTYDYISDEDLEKKMKEYEIDTTEPKDSITVVINENEMAYRDQTIITYDTKNEKIINQTIIKVPYAELVNNKWVDLNPPRIIWVDEDGNEVKRSN